MRVVSMVPSWTETLIAAGVDVVGRTRFCIHPRERVKNIPSVGGTKKVDLKKLRDIDFDLLILDKEENPIEMSEYGYKFWASHIRSVHDMPPALEELGEILANQKLKEGALRWRQTLKGRALSADVSRLPVRRWLKEPPPSATFETVQYIIWRDPWMAVSLNTFIGSMLQRTGFLLPNYDKAYPVLDGADIDKPESLILFASEPYPFLKRPPEVLENATGAAIVDGESLSWFGVRALRYLETAVKQSI